MKMLLGDVYEALGKLVQAGFKDKEVFISLDSYGDRFHPLETRPEIVSIDDNFEAVPESTEKSRIVVAIGTP